MKSYTIFALGKLLAKEKRKPKGRRDRPPKVRPHRPGDGGNPGIQDLEGTKSPV